MIVSKLDQSLNKLKAAKAGLSLPKHEVWIPIPEKEKAKLLGVKWNSEHKHYEFGAALDKLGEHPAARYLPGKFIPLKSQLPFDVRDEFKELGVISVPNADGVWHNYVMGHEDYQDLIAGLMEEGYL